MVKNGLAKGRHMLFAQVIGRVEAVLTMFQSGRQAPV